jgi:Tfp pilus assembly protein PilO
MNERNVTIVSIVILSLTLLGGGLGIYYLRSNMATKTRERNNLKAEVDDAVKKQGELPKLKAQRNALNEKIKAGEERVPRLDELQYDELADLIDSLRKLASVTLSDARFSSPKTKVASASMHRATYDINLKGGFFNLLRFINLVEAQKRYIGVASFSIADAGGDAMVGKGSLIPIRSMRVQIFSFTRKPGKGAPTPTTEIKAPEPEKAPSSTPLP